MFRWSCRTLSVHTTRFLDPTSSSPWNLKWREGAFCLFHVFSNIQSTVLKSIYNITIFSLVRFSLLLIVLCYDHCSTVKLAYDIFTAVNGSNQNPIIISHGLLGCKRNWRSIACELNKRGFGKVLILLHLITSTGFLCGFSEPRI